MHVFVGPESAEEARRALADAGAHVHVTQEDESGLRLEAVLEVLWERGIRSILCEGGGELGAGLLREGLVQRLYLFVSPTVLGSDGVAAFPDPRSFPEPAGWTPHPRVETFGSDVLITYDFRGSDSS